MRASLHPNLPPNPNHTGGLRANYHKCLPIDHKEHKHIKTIAHTSKAGVAQDLCFEGPHSLQYDGGTCSLHNTCKPSGSSQFLIQPLKPHRKHPNHTVVDELKRDVVGPFTKTPSHTRLALLHYVLRSRQVRSMMVFRFAYTDQLHHIHNAGF